MEGKEQPKISVEEFLSVAERFGFSTSALERISNAISEQDLPPGGPHLGRYYGSANPSMGDRFEELAREVFQVKHAVATSSGTAALHAGMVACGAAPGKEVICAGTGFVATAMATALAGAKPVMCDIDDSFLMDPLKIESLITKNTVAIAPTHVWGMVADLDPILEIARRHQIRVVEDCAQSPGASYKGRPVGSIGDVGCFSISSYKLIGGGEGGMAVTSDPLLADRIAQTVEAGGLWRPNRFASERYEGELFVGSNYRPSELESAVNVIQIQKLKPLVERYRRNYRAVRGAVHPVQEVEWQASNDPEGDIGYQMRLYPRTHELGKKIATALTAEGVGASYRGENSGPDWHLSSDMYPLHRAFPDQIRAGICPVADDLFRRSIQVGCNQWWSPSDCASVAKAFNKVFAACCTPA